MPGAPATGGGMRIALLCPHAWPPRDDVTHHVAAEAAALARRGHRVTILAPATGRARVAAGRSLLEAAREGDGAALSPVAPGVLEVGLGRAAMAGALEEVLSEHPWDVVHLHDPQARAREGPVEERPQERHPGERLGAVERHGRGAGGVPQGRERGTGRQRLVEVHDVPRVLREHLLQRAGHRRSLLELSLIHI